MGGATAETISGQLNSTASLVNPEAPRAELSRATSSDTLPGCPSAALASLRTMDYGGTASWTTRRIPWASTSSPSVIS